MSNTESNPELYESLECPVVEGHRLIQHLASRLMLDQALVAWFERIIRGEVSSGGYRGYTPPVRWRARHA